MKSSNQEGKPERVIDPDTIYQALTDQLEMYCAENRIEDMRTESESGWQAFLQYVSMVLFAREPVPHLFLNTNSILLENDDLLYMVYKWFTINSRKYNKTCNPYNFGILTNIDIETMQSWLGYRDYISDSNIYNTDNAINNSLSSDRGYKLTYKRYEIAKTIYRAYEESLTAALTTGKNPVGTIAILNRRFGWANSEMQIQSKPQMIAAQDLPVLAPPDQQ